MGEKVKIDERERAERLFGIYLAHIPSMTNFKLGSSKVTVHANT